MCFAALSSLETFGCTRWACNWTKPNLPIYLYLTLSIYLSFNLSIYLSIYLCDYLSMCPSTYLSFSSTVSDGGILPARGSLGIDSLVSAKWLRQQVSRLQAPGMPLEQVENPVIRSDGHGALIWVWLKIKRSEGQTAGFGPCFHLPGQLILEFRFFEPQPFGKCKKTSGRMAYLLQKKVGINTPPC